MAGEEVPEKEERILPDYPIVLGNEMMELIHIALGAASTSWDPMDCTGVFMEHRCRQLGSELMQAVNLYVQCVDFIGANDQAAIVLAKSGDLTLTEDTMQKVYRGLRGVGLSENLVINAVHAMMNEGVLFREVKPDDTETE